MTILSFVISFENLLNKLHKKFGTNFSKKSFEFFLDQNDLDTAL